MRLSRGRGTAGAQDKERKFSILRRSRTVTSIIHPSENSSTTCFLCTHSMDLFAAPFRNVGPAPLDRPQVDLQQGPAERSARSLLAVYVQLFFFFFEACFAKTVETPSPPPPPNVRSSFRKLLRTFATAPNKRPCTKSAHFRHRPQTYSNSKYILHNSRRLPQKLVLVYIFGFFFFFLSIYPTVIQCENGSLRVNPSRWFRPTLVVELF